mgnify:FL=1|jgi:hypothetical protein
MTDFDPNETGGGALTVGFLLVLAVLYRNPANGLEAAMVGPQSVLYFLVFPAVGILAGVYAAIDGPYHTALLFFLGSYLGVFGLALTVGRLLAPDPISLSLWIGLALLPLSVTVLLASLQPLVATLQLGVPYPPGE